MARLEVKRQMGRGDIAAVSELLDVAAEVDGHRPLGEHQWLDLVHGGRHGFAGLVAWEPGHDHPVGYAQVTREEQAHFGEAGAEETRRPTWALEYVVDPHHRQADPEIGHTLVSAALAVVAEEGGGHVHLWVPKPTEVHDAVAAACGLRHGRELLQLRRALPLHETWSLTVRAFVPGADEQAWLAVNNRAFHWHAEQGGWDLATLASRAAQPWFDPEGLLLHEREGALAGFCWTKIQPDERDPHSDRTIGEIYVIAVDPAFQGLGLGRCLLLAGLDCLHDRGIEEAMLYVDADNAPAVKLYESLDFTTDHLDRAYVGDVPPAPPTPPTPTAEPRA